MTMLAEARTSAHPDLDAAIRPRLGAVVEMARQQFGHALRSVLLGGSLARSEALGVRHDGTLCLLSDLDLYFVVEGAPAGDFELRISRWAESDPFLVARPDVAVVTPDWFAAGAHKMPIHQLAHAHLVLWGEAVPVPAEGLGGAPGRVDARDAAELLFNRFVESLDPALDHGDGLLRAMHRTKEYIDAPMAWLAANGRYRPDRREQLELLQEMASALPAGPGRRFEACLEHWRTCLDARGKGLLDEDELRRLSRAPAEPLPGGALWRDWTGGFALALLGQTGLETVRDCLEEGLPEDGFTGASGRWLRRERLLPRLRRARRWCTVAPPEATAWWRHGSGGSAPDRIFAAAALRYLGFEDWSGPVRKLVEPPIGAAADLHDLWWRWIQGRGHG